ncbi:uncharacterized protein [Ovis canadensis]|uniref:uncharacterized protein isoform X2 n=1 Tax=Ovis canadensis TaxID=37174 RepID=UPI003751A551
MENCWQQVTHRIFHDSQPLKMNLTNPQRQLDKWPLSVQMEQPWRCLEYARMEDCLQQRTRCVFHDNCSGKTRRVSPQGLLGNWSFDVQVDHPWRFLLMLHIEIRYGNNGKAIPHQFGREKLFLLRDVLAQISLNPQQCGLTGSDVREKGYFAAWNSTATPKKCCFRHLYELLSLGKFTAMLSRDDFLGALLVMNDTSKPLKEDSSDRALLPPCCLRAASEGDDHRDKVDLLL